MSERLKNLIKEIHKIAQVPSRSRGPKTTERAPATTAPTGTRPISSVPHKNTPGKAAPVKPVSGFTSNIDVKKLQEAILQFADVASATDVTSMTGKEGRMTGDQTRAIPVVDEKNVKPGDLTHEQATQLNEQTKEDKNYLGGSDAFGKFITQNYIPKNSFIGKQYLNVDVSGQANRQSASMKPTNLRGIIDTIKRVGSPNAKGEKTVDGIWQTRTNNALHVIGDLMSAMLSFTKDMGMQIPGYTEKDLAVFKNQIPESYTELKSSEEIISKARELTPHLHAMTKYFENLNTQVFNNQNIRKYIDQKEAFVKYPKSIQIPSNMRAFGIPGVQFDWIQNPSQNWISLNELSSLDNFKEFLKRVRVSENDPESVKKILDLVAQKINVEEPGY